MKTKTLHATSILMVMRDDTRAQAKTILEKAEADLQLAKEAYHRAKIESNRLLRWANEVQLAINEELGLQVQEQQAVAESYEYKSTSQLAADYLQSGKE